MSDNPRPTCSICPYWDDRPVDVNKGTCHRNPPPAGNGSSWRVATAPDDFCGEHPSMAEYIATTRGKSAPVPADLERMQDMYSWERAFRIKTGADLDRVSRLCDVYADEIVKLNKTIADHGA